MASYDKPFVKLGDPEAIDLDTAEITVPYQHVLGMYNMVLKLQWLLIYHGVYDPDDLHSCPRCNSQAARHLKDCTNPLHDEERDGE